SYARTRSILRKAVSEGANDVAWRASPFVVQSPAERALALQMIRFEDTLTQSMQDYLPNVITEYLFDLAKLFSSFYDQCPVLKAESDELKLARLKITELTGRVLQQGLRLLGIDTVERM
ncbi:MAG: arginine--tRNA ligase, partial [Planctomycetes bacterium]|nr:arginine--tRNA ligase [Planctomycetota bacterium]